MCMLYFLLSTGSVYNFTMTRLWSLLLLVMHLCLTGAHLNCPEGYSFENNTCSDEDECAPDDDDPDYVTPCGNNTNCKNTKGSFFCQCQDGFRASENLITFTASSSATCTDINECLENEDICGPNTHCKNTIPHFICYCKEGFNSTSGVNVFKKEDNVSCRDIDECVEADTCGKNAACKNTPGSYYCICNAGFVLKSGETNFTGTRERCEDICLIKNPTCGNGTCHAGATDYYCACHSGFSNYGNIKSRCTELNCEVFKDMSSLKENFITAHDLMVQLKKKCQELAVDELTDSETSTEGDERSMLMRLLSMIDELLSGKPFPRDNKKISTFLDMVENFLRFIGPFNTPPGVKIYSNYTEIELHVHKGSVLPQGSVTLSLAHAKLDIQMATVAGEPSQYPDFATVSLLCYKNLEGATDGFFKGMNKQERETFKINSKVVTVTVSNRNTSLLNEPVLITFYHLQQSNRTSHCVFWDSSVGGGTWSSHGCSVKESNSKYTVCSCEHLSSFAVLMALYEVEDRFELELITWVGLSLSLICLFICILTFALIRPIQSLRTKIHLHLCISLFLAFFVFLVGISRTENRVGCAVVAGLLHFFFLASFCWMCLEGIQLFRMVVLVFNTSVRTVYLMAAGYGVPAVIVTISAFANASGYGTERYCWLNLDSIWSFYGPACVIIIANVIFFLITVWKLAQKFSSLNPDLDNLQKIKTFTITAVAQLCVLGTMWIFGCFQFDERTIVMSYLFTIFASLQGVMLFVMHCLFSKQVRDEYRSILSRCCAPQKKTYSEFDYTHSSKPQGSKSTQDTGESRM